MSQNLGSKPAFLRTAHRVLLADSDPIFLRGLHVSLAGKFDIEGELTTSQECLASAPNAEILVMGFSLACGRNALGLLPDLRQHHSKLAVIVLLSPTTGWMAPRLLAAGACGVLSRRMAPGEVPVLINDAIHRRPLPPLLSRRPRESSTAGSIDLSVLTARELEIFRLLGLGKSGKEIASLLGISGKTVSAQCNAQQPTEGHTTKSQNTMKTQKTILAALGLLALGTTISQAEITIETVTVGDIGNAASTDGIGAVGYAYNIGTKEVNLTQYTAFLNAVAATDTYGLYNTGLGTDLNIAGITQNGVSGNFTYAVIGSGNRPVTYVSWFDAARFSNWMANGQTPGAQGANTTEDGAYSLNGATSGVNFAKNAVNPNTGSATTFWIPSDDEWYKAAYYEPSHGGPNDDYWLYPTQSDNAPGNVIGSGANQANYYNGVYSVTQSGSYPGSQNYLTDGGAFSASFSHYGTFDQGGNALEWNDAVQSGVYRFLRGGSWFGSDFDMLSSLHDVLDPSFENSYVGFRVASVPEPSTYALIAIGLGTLLIASRRARARS